MLKIQSDRVIIDGHEPTKEQCETMTLLANALAESENFKTVKYESGYAEFEKVGKADELKFPLDGPGSFSMYDSSTGDEVLYVSSDSTSLAITFSGNELTLTAEADFMFIIKRSNSSYVESYSPSDGSGALNIPVIVKMKKQIENIDGYNIKFAEASAVSRKSIDLTTLPGWASLADGSHNITIVAKASGYRDSEPSAAVQVVKAGGFVQIFPTKTSDNCTLFENLNQSKIYTINTSSYHNGLKYENGTWMTTFGGSIEAQTDNSVKMKIMAGSIFEAIVSGITLEGDTEAADSDFEGFSPTTVYAMWACFAEGTKITLSDGSTKLIQDIQYGDRVLCYDFTNGTQTTSHIDWKIPERIATKYWEITLSDGTILNLVGSNGKSHRLYNVTKQRFDYPQDFEPSDLTLKEDGTTAYVLSCREIEKEVKFYNIASHEHINVYANGVLTSNRLNNRFKIVDNKFTDEKAMNDKEVEDYCDYLERIKAV